MRLLAILVILLFVAMAGCKDNYQNSTMEHIELQDGSSVQFKPLKEEEYSALKKDAVKGPITQYKDEFGLEIYVLSNGQVIGKDKGYFALYLSLSDLDRVLSDFKEHGSHGAEILLNKNKYGEDFPKMADSLILDLLKELKIPGTGPSEALLKTVDAKMDSLQNSQGFKRQHLIHLIALIGEVVRKNYDAEWLMKLASDGCTWHPYLKVKGQKVEFVTYLYEDIFLKDKSEEVLDEIYHTVEGIIRSNLR